jgi:hypothetical protein
MFEDLEFNTFFSFPREVARYVDSLVVYDPAEDDEEFSLFISNSDCSSAISGKINFVFEGFLELVDNFVVDLHFKPCACRTHRQRMQKENWQDILEHSAQLSIGFTREGEVHLGHDFSCSPGASLDAS